MSKTRNLYKRGNVFYGRVAAPRALRELRKASGLQKQSEVHRSLDTSDLKEAQRRLASFLDQCYQAFEREEAQLRSDGVKPLRPPTAEDLAAIRRHFFKAELQIDEWERMEWESPSEIEAVRQQVLQQIANDPPRSMAELIRLPGYLDSIGPSSAEISVNGRKDLKRELTTHLAQNEFRMVRGIIDGYCQDIGLHIEPTSHEYKSLARGLIKEWIKALEVTEQRDQGIYDPRHDNEAAEANLLAGGGNASADVVDLSAEREKHPRKGYETLGIVALRATWRTSTPLARSGSWRMRRATSNSNRLAL